MSTKYCKRCDRTLPIEHFHKHRNSKDGHAFYCKDCASEYGRKYRENSWVSVYSMMRGNVTSYHRKPFNISKEEFKKWYLTEPRKCAYCDLREEYISLIDDSQLNRSKRLTIDCMENSKGYVVDNIVLSCLRCNFMKNDLLGFKAMREIGQKHIKPIWIEILSTKNLVY